MSLWSIFGQAAAPTGLPAGQRIYAVGDIHGRMDLFGELMVKIARDAKDRALLRTRCVVLGDFIDRGEESAELIKFFAAQQSSDFIILKGNHETALLDALRGDHDAMDLWVKYGGLATLRSFGVPDAQIDTDDTATLIKTARKMIPKHVVAWLTSLPVSFRCGGYFFVHAGIRPGVKFSRQSEHDLLWIRDEFTLDDSDHGRVVVHGHTVYDDGVFFAKNRIGVDTGAYRTGCLSAVGLEGEERWVVDTGQTGERGILTA